MHQPFALCLYFHGRQRPTTDTPLYLLRPSPIGFRERKTLKNLLGLRNICCPRLEVGYEWLCNSICTISYDFELLGSNLNDPNDPVRRENTLVNSACEAYEEKANEIIRWASSIAGWIVTLTPHMIGHTAWILLPFVIFLKQ